MKRREFITRSALTAVSARPLLQNVLRAENDPHGGPRKVMTLQSKGIILQITPEGLLWEMTNVHSGHSYLVDGGHSIWKFILSSEKEWILPVLSGDSAAQVRAKGDGLEIVHDSIRLRDQSVPIKVTTSVQLKGDDEMEWAIRIENHSPYTVEEVWCPLMGKIDSLSGDPAKDHLIWPSHMGARIPHPRATFDVPGGSSTPNLANRATFAVDRGWSGYSDQARRYRIVYPGRACMQWFGLYTDTEGLYMGSHDKTLQTATLNLMNSDEGLSLSFIKYPYVHQGETWSSEPFVVAVEGGDWHLGAKRYRRWTDTWLRLPESPRWLQDMDGWLLTMMKYPGGRINWNYRGLLELWEATKAAGMNVIKINGWWPEGMDRAKPIYHPDPDMGGEKELRSAIEKIKSEGGKVFMYLNGATIDPVTPFGKAKGPVWGAKNQEGQVYMQSHSFFSLEGSIWDEMVSGQKLLYCACHSVKAYQDVLLGDGKQVVGYGADGVTYDQTGTVEPWLCYDTSHGHQKPSLANGKPTVDNMLQIREALRTINPEVAMETEGTCDAIAQAFELCTAPDLGEAFGTLTFPELYRYTYPEKALIKSHLDTDNPYILHCAFVYGMKFGTHPGRGAGTLAEYPRLTQRIRYLVGLRNQYPDLLRNGRFIDNEWGSVDNPAILAKGYQHGDQIAVIMWNHSFEEQRYKLALPNHQLVRVIPGDSVSLSGKIPADDICVVIAKAG